MSIFGPMEYCAAGEFEAGLASRRHPSSFHFDEFYTLMLSFRTNQPELKVANAPMELTDMPFQKDGLWIVRFALMDNTFQPVSYHETHFENGLITHADEDLQSPVGHYVDSGYVRRTVDYLDLPLPELAAASALPAARERALVAA